MDNIMQRLHDNQVHHAALLYDDPGPHPEDQACQAISRVSSVAVVMSVVGFSGIADEFNFKTLSPSEHRPPAKVEPKINEPGDDTHKPRPILNRHWD